MSNKIMFEADYGPHEKYEWAIDLPKGKTYEDIDNIDIRWLSEVTIYFKDDSEHKLILEPEDCLNYDGIGIEAKCNLAEYKTPESVSFWDYYVRHRRVTVYRIFKGTSPATNNEEKGDECTK